MPQWVSSWAVPRSDGKGDWTVSIAADGTWGCDCPQWKFRRLQCKHIQATKADMADQPTSGTLSRSLLKKAGIGVQPLPATDDWDTSRPTKPKRRAWAKSVQPTEDRAPTRWLPGQRVVNLD